MQEITIQDLPKSKMTQELSPSRANRSRLAHDIMRALGRPVLLAPRDSTQSAQSISSAALKRSSEQDVDVAVPTSPKRQRMSPISSPPPPSFQAFTHQDITVVRTFLLWKSVPS